MPPEKDPTRFCSNWIDSYIQYTKRSEPPKLFHKWCAVSVIASALQRKCWLEWGPFPTYPNMYIVLIAPPGRARKGTAMKYAQDFLKPLDLPVAAESVTRESLIRLLKGAERTFPLKDGTALTHSSLTVFSPELTVFLGYANLQLMGDLTDWFDCAEHWTYHTKTSGTDEIKGIFINLLGATTPDLMRSSLPSDAIGGGLTSRIVFVYEENKDHLEAYPMLANEDKILKEKLQADMESINQLSGPFTVSQDFFSVWGDWYLNESEKTPFGLSHTRTLDGYCERRPIQLLKLSMIMSANRSSSMAIEACDFHSALALLTATEKNMPLALGGIGSSEHAGLVYQILNRIERAPIFIDELTSLFMYDGDTTVLDEIVKVLKRTGKIRERMVDNRILYESANRKRKK